VGGRLLKGRLRLNPRNTRTAYVTPEGNNPFKVGMEWRREGGKKGGREGGKKGGRERGRTKTKEARSHSCTPSLPPSFLSSLRQVDILIDGRKDRNRALEGDVVAVEVWPLSKWGMKRREQQQEEQPQEEEEQEVGSPFCPSLLIDALLPLTEMAVLSLCPSATIFPLFLSSSDLPLFLPPTLVSSLSATLIDHEEEEEEEEDEDDDDE